MNFFDLVGTKANIGLADDMLIKSFIYNSTQRKSLKSDNQVESYCFSSGIGTENLTCPGQSCFIVVYYKELKSGKFTFFIRNCSSKFTTVSILCQNIKS